MARTILIWAGVLAAGAFLLQWLEAQYLLRVFSRDIYVGIIGAGFAAGGVWLGWKLNARPRSTAQTPAVAEGAGLTGQERRVLAELAAGRSNKEIARARPVAQHGQDPPRQPLRQARGHPADPGAEPGAGVGVDSLNHRSSRRTPGPR